MKRLNTILLLLALAAMSLFTLSGCSSDDGVSPDETPNFTAEDVATQSAAVAMAMGQVLQNLNSKAEGVERTINEEYVYGSYWDDGEADRVWTDSAHMLYVDFNGLPHEIEADSPVNFDITAPDDTNLANGTGSVDYTSSYTVTFTIVNVVLDPGNYPVGGQVLVSAALDAIITFFAGHTAQVEIGTDAWAIDMETAEITPI